MTLYAIVKQREDGTKYVERKTTMLPERIRLPDGCTRTALDQATDEELQAFGVLPIVTLNAEYDEETEICVLQSEEILTDKVRITYTITAISEEVLAARAVALLEAAWGAIRATRNQLLAETDRKWDAPNREAYALYRQSLRDIPATYPTPDAVIWPDKPE